jgi:hypothetical protein
MTRTNQTLVEEPRQEPTQREPESRKNALEQSVPKRYSPPEPPPECHTGTTVLGLPRIAHAKHPFDTPKE